MRRFEIGDKVSVVSETLNGEVIRVQDDQITFRDEDGFEWTYASNELALLSDEAFYTENIGKKTEELMNEKIRSDKYQTKKVKELKEQETCIDLHIEELTDDHANLTNFEIVSIQMEACKRFVRKSLDQRTNKIVIIHGKGQGVLRSEVHNFLDKLRVENEINLEYHDAAFTASGIGGATEIIFYG